MPANDPGRVRFAGGLSGRDLRAPAIGPRPRQSGDWRSHGRGSRFSQHGSTRARLRFEARRRPREFRRNATNLPESPAVHSETDVHNLQNWRVPSSEPVRNAAFFPEAAAVHPEGVCILCKIRVRRAGNGGERSFPKVPRLRAAAVATFTLKPIPKIPENAPQPPARPGAGQPWGAALQRIAERRRVAVLP
jgi:hypothetical protein